MFLFQLHERRLQKKIFFGGWLGRKKPEHISIFTPQMMSEEHPHLVLFA